MIDGKGAELVSALGARGADIALRIDSVGAQAIAGLDQQMTGLTDLMARRTDELVAAVSGSAGEPVRALAALVRSLRLLVAVRAVPAICAAGIEPKAQRSLRTDQLPTLVETSSTH